MLGEKWQLRPELVRSMRNHHAGMPGDVLSDCVFAANQVAKLMSPADSGNPVIEPLPEAITARFGGDIDTLAVSLAESSGDMVEDAAWAGDML